MNGNVSTQSLLRPEPAGLNHSAASSQTNIQYASSSAPLSQPLPIPCKAVIVNEKMPHPNENDPSPPNSIPTDITSEEEGRVIHMDMDKPVTKRGWRFYGTFACLALLNLICAIDATILAVALPTIATSLNGTAIEAFWCGTSFLLTSTVFQPSWASFSHIIGHKLVLLAALLIFTVGTIVASAAQNMTDLLVGRSIQGVGGGGLVTLTYVVVAGMVTLRERGKWFSIISLQWAIGSLTGPVIGGCFAEKASWRWIFWLNIPFCAISAVGIPICLRLHAKEGSVWTRLRGFDWLGSVLFVASATSFLIPITWGGVMYPWSSWRTLLPFLVGAIGLVVFLVYNIYYATQFFTEPVIRRSLFNSSTSISAYFGTTIIGILVWSMLYYLPLYFEVAKDYSPIASGVVLFPITFTTGPAAVVVGLLITKTGRFRVSVWVGWFFTTLGVGLLIYLRQNTNLPSWIFLSLVVGLGAGILYSAQSFAAQSSVVSADLAFAGSMYSFFRSLGQTLGVAISGAVFQNIFKMKIKQTAYAAYAQAWSSDASAFVQVVKTWRSEGEEGIKKAVVVQAYVESLQMVWVVVCVLSAIAFVASLIFVKELSLERELDTDQGFRYDHQQKRPES